jgi:zinc protease
MKNLVILSALWCILLSCTAYALDVKEFNLDNGLKVLIVEDHKAPTATFQVWYRVGAVNENTGKTGLSHLLEHMMFKGTSKYGPKTFSQTIQRAGGIDNAYTTEEYTVYFDSLASDRMGLPVELEADRMQHLNLTPRAVLSERDVVMEERRLRYEDEPRNLIYETVKAAAFSNHPYRWPVIGWMSDLKTLNPEDLIAHYRTYYAPNNAVVVVVGDMNPGEMLSKIKDSFGKIPRGPALSERGVKEDIQHGEKRVYVKKEAALPYILCAFKVPNITNKDGYALEVLGTILSEGKSSRLYHSLVYEKGLAISAWAEYEGFYKDPFLFLAGATAAKGRKPEEVEKALLEEMEKIKKAPPSEHEVRKAKNQIEASFIMGQDSFNTQAATIGRFEMTGGWRLMEKYLDGIGKVSPEDVRAVAVKYLVDDRKTTGVLIPLKAEGTDVGNR